MACMASLLSLGLLEGGDVSALDEEQCVCEAGNTEVVWCFFSAAGCCVRPEGREYACFLCVYERVYMCVCVCASVRVCVRASVCVGGGGLYSIDIVYVSPCVCVLSLSLRTLNVVGVCVRGIFFPALSAPHGPCL